MENIQSGERSVIYKILNVAEAVAQDKGQNSLRAMLYEALCQVTA